MGSFQDIINATVYDLDGFMRPYWGLLFAQHIARLDREVESKKITITDVNRIFLDKIGHIHIQDMTKLPVMDSKNRVTSILTLSCDKTNKASLFELLSLYKSAYKKKSNAINNFSSYLGVNSCFNDSLTEKEIICLLCMRQDKCYKSVANEMNVSTKTVETHISNMISKSKKRNLSEPLTILRSH